MTTKHSAIVFGASGLLGWSVVNQILSRHKDAGSFESVAAVMKRRVSKDDLDLPASSPDHPSFEIVPGIDLQHGTGEELAGELATRVPHIEEITHAFYFGAHLKFGVKIKH